MKEVVFDESQLGDLSAVAQQLFFSGTQPGEPGYQRVLVRPAIRWGRIALQCLLALAAACALFAAAAAMLPWYAALAVAAAGMLICLLVRAKAVIITLVQIYQRFAPDEIRDKCRFEPSCSEYMIRAVRKYGACRGVCRGIGRLCRCNINHGGYDEP